MYICGLVLAVPEGKKDAYRDWAERSAEVFKRYGCLEIVESWEDFVPDGKRTDFRRAVDAKQGEKIVFAWQIWPDKESLKRAEVRMHADNALDVSGEIPFDASRMILGCFAPIATM